MNDHDRTRARARVPPHPSRDRGARGPRSRSPVGGLEARDRHPRPPPPALTVAGCLGAPVYILTTFGGRPESPSDAFRPDARRSRARALLAGLAPPRHLPRVPCRREDPRVPGTVRPAHERVLPFPGLDGGLALRLRAGARQERGALGDARRARLLPDAGLRATARDSTSCCAA